MNAMCLSAMFVDVIMQLAALAMIAGTVISGFLANRFDYSS